MFGARGLALPVAVGGCQWFQSLQGHSGWQPQMIISTQVQLEYSFFEDTRAILRLSDSMIDKEPPSRVFMSLLYESWPKQH